MSDYLSRIAARNLNLAEVVQPRMWSLFEPPSADGGSVFEQHFGSGEQDEIFVSDETEPYAHASMLPSSPLLADRSAESALSEKVRTKKVGTARRKAADPQTPILSQPQSDLDEAKRHPIPEITENIPVATSSEKELPGQRRSTYSAATFKAEPPRAGRRKAVDAQPLTSETILGRPLPDQTKTETVPPTANSETERIESPSSSQVVPKQGPSEQRQTASPAMIVETETRGTVRRKASLTPTTTSKTIPGHLSPYPNKTETIPATANGEKQRIGTPSPSQKTPKKVPPDQRQTATPEVTAKTETVGTVRQKVADSQSSSRKVPKQTPPDQRQTEYPTEMVKTETVRRKAVDNQPRLPGSILNRSRKESDEAKRQPVTDRAEMTIVTAKSKIAPPDLRQQEPFVAAVGFETARRVRQKVADVQPRASETIQSLPWSDLERTRRRPGSENAPYLEVITEGHPSSRRVQLPSCPERDRSPKVGIDAEGRIVSGRVAAERELLLAPSSRSQAISPPEVTRLVAPKDPIKNHPAETKPTIQVKIGRVEVRAAAPTAPTSPPSHGIPQPAPKLSLDDYLKQRDGGRP